MIPVFIGYDRRETIAWSVLAHSLLRHSSLPLAITPVGNDVLPAGLWWRKRAAVDSTDFSNARFIVPALCDWRGWAIFLDCDMVCLGDLAELWRQRDPRYAVQVVKHDHRPRETSKFLGATQAAYPRKNWSSLMLLNCAHPAMLDLNANERPGLDLHGFGWCPDEAVGEIRGLWNVLATDRYEHPEPVERESIRLLHYTLGGPWHGYRPPGARHWWAALSDMLAGGNPCARSGWTFDADRSRIDAEYRHAPA